MFASVPPVTRTLILLNVGLFLIERWTNGAILNSLALWPLGPHFEPWQIVTYAFLHDFTGYEHIYYHLFAVWMFGSTLERFWGPRRYLAFYLASVVTAALAQLLVTSILGQDFPTVGASGGIFGLLLGYAMFFPRQKVLILLLIPMPAWLFVTLYGAGELYLGVTGTQAGVAHFAHLGGMLGGWLTILSWRQRDRPSAPRPQ
jgi:membrane associated rhomboid family serine protease